MPAARIFERPKSTMQSGRALTHRWVLEYEPAEAKRPDPLTGWAGSGDMLGQVRLGFATLEAAQAYATREGIDAQLIPTPEKKLHLRAYAENFR